MSEAISKAEVQLCMAAKNIRKPTFSQNALRGFGELAFKDDLQDWSAEFEQLLARNIFRTEGDKDLCEGRIVEGSAIIGLVNAGRMCRYLYHIKR